MKTEKIKRLKRRFGGRKFGLVVAGLIGVVGKCILQQGVGSDDMLLVGSLIGGFLAAEGARDVMAARGQVEDPSAALISQSVGLVAEYLKGKEEIKGEDWICPDEHGKYISKITGEEIPPGPPPDLNDAIGALRKGSNAFDNGFRNGYDGVINKAHLFKEHSKTYDRGYEQGEIARIQLGERKQANFIIPNRQETRSWDNKISDFKLGCRGGFIQGFKGEPTDIPEYFSLNPTTAYKQGFASGHASGRKCQLTGESDIEKEIIKGVIGFKKFLYDIEGTQDLTDRPDSNYPPSTMDHVEFPPEPVAPLPDSPDTDFVLKNPKEL